MTTLTCKNHPNSKAIYRCKTCAAAICSLCFNKIQYNEGEKNVGFCSGGCREQYVREIKIARKQNFPRAVGELSKGVIILAVAVTILFFALHLVESGNSNDGTKFYFFFSMSIGITGLIKIFNVVASFKSGFRDLKKHPAKIENDFEDFEADDSHEVIVSTEVKPSSISDALIICYNIPYDELKSGIAEFQNIMSNSDERKQVKHIISFFSKDEITLLKFKPAIHPYMLYNLMDYFDDSNALAYFDLRGEKYLLRNEKREDFLYCLDTRGKAYKISKVDGSMSKIKVCKYQFLDLTINIDDLSKKGEMPIVIEDPGDFGLPVL